jgi:hypothetical protein
LSSLFKNRLPRLGVIISAGLLLSSLIYLAIHNKRAAPVAPVIATCETLKPGLGLRRIGEQEGLQFDILEREFRIHEGTQDAPPFVHAFYIRPQHSESSLNISFGPPEWEGVRDPDLAVLNHLEKRNVLDKADHQVGEDDWGYLRTRERWRRVQFRGGTAKYRFVSRKDADLFDQVIDSVCVLSDK